MSLGQLAHREPPEVEAEGDTRATAAVSLSLERLHVMAHPVLALSTCEQSLSAHHGPKKILFSRMDQRVTLEAQGRSVSRDGFQHQSFDAAP